MIRSAAVDGFGDPLVLVVGATQSEARRIVKLLYKELVNLYGERIDIEIASRNSIVVGDTEFRVLSDCPYFEDRYLRGSRAKVFYDHYVFEKRYP
jgi:hypothetical protein